MAPGTDRFHQIETGAGDLVTTSVRPGAAGTPGIVWLLLTPALADTAHVWLTPSECRLLGASLIIAAERADLPG